MSWTDQLQGQPANYAPIIQTLIPADGVALESIYTILLDHATVTGSSLEEYVIEERAVNFSEKLADPNTPINPANLATLKAVGVIISPDNVHIGPTILGLGFLTLMQNQ